MYFGTDFDLNIKATTDAGPLRIHRHIELTFAQTGKAWLVTAYRVQAVRKSPTTDHDRRRDRDRRDDAVTTRRTASKRVLLTLAGATTALVLGVRRDLRRVAGGRTRSDRVGRHVPARREAHAARGRGSRRRRARARRSSSCSSATTRGPGVGGARGDALHVLGVNPAKHQATMIDIPRDTCWAGDKINVGNTRGPRAQADDVGGLLGVQISYVVDVDFAGFTGLVDGIGGVDVNVPDADARLVLGRVLQPGQDTT